MGDLSSQIKGDILAKIKHRLLRGEQRGAPGRGCWTGGTLIVTSLYCHLPLGFLTLLFSISPTVANRAFLKTLSREGSREINSRGINSKTQPGSLHVGF